MATYRVTIDGRTVVLSGGDTPPTESDARAALAKYESNQPNQVMGGLDRFANAAMMNLGDEISSAGKATGDYLKDKLGLDDIEKELSWRERYNKYAQQEENKSDLYERTFPNTALAAELTGTIASPVNKILAPVKGAGFVRNAMRGAGGGGIMGLLHGIGSTKQDASSDELSNNISNDAALGMIGGAIIPAVLQPVMRGAGLAIGRSGELLRRGVGKIPGVGGFFEKAPGEIVDSVVSKTGREGSRDILGAEYRSAAKGAMDAVKSAESAAYREADDLAAGSKISLGINSNLAETLRDLYKNTTKSGRSYLIKIWKETGRKPTYDQARALKSKISADSVNGVNGLTSKQVGQINGAIDADIATSIGDKANLARKAADSMYRAERTNPDSIINIGERTLGKTGSGLASGQVGNRLMIDLTQKTGNLSAAKRLLEGADNLPEIKREVQSLVKTRAQFNAMSPEQKKFIYGKELPDFEKIFNGGFLPRLEQATNSISQTLRNMNIPNIGAPVAVGTSTENRPNFLMQLLRGN